MNRSPAVWVNVAAGWALCLAGGCSVTNVGQLERCQADKKQLLSRVVEEQKRSENLTTELRAANQRLADAEKQLARYYDHSRGRLAAGGSNSPGLGSNGPGFGGGGQGFGSQGAASPALPLVGGVSSRSFQAGPEPIGAGVAQNPSSPGLMASGTSASGASRPVALGPWGGATTGGGSRSAEMGSAASPSLDPSGFDQLAPLNGRSESGWMPKSGPRR